MKQKGTHLLIAISVKVLFLNDGAEVEADVVDHIGRVFRQIQQHEVEVQPNHTIDQREPNFNFPLKKKQILRDWGYLFLRKFRISCG